MIFYYAIRTLASDLNGVRVAIFSMAVSIRNVWLIGDTLYSWFTQIAAYISLVVNRLYILSDNWLTTYNDLKQAGIYIPGLSELLYYAEDIISIARDFAGKIGQAIRQRYPNIYQFNFDPVNYILNVLYQHTGLSYSFLLNPLAAIAQAVRNELGDIRSLIYNPYAYIVGKLTQGNPLLYYLLIDPRLWLKIELGNLAPFLQAFLYDPTHYIIESVLAGVENLLEYYSARIAKIAEKILSAMF
jgi:hypothetical protein